jgi:hypothetical protein
MTGLQDPPGFIVRTEAQKAAADNGYRLEGGGAPGGWLQFGSTTALGEIWIGAEGNAGPWLLSLGHTGAAAELGDLPQAPLTGPGILTLLLPHIADLHAALDRVYRLSVSLPDAPLRRFEREAQKLPRSTEAERLVVQRVGQNIFRDALLDYWNGRCPITGVADPRLLRASHIKPWAACDTDAERLDVHNGLLLAAHLDAAFDAGLISFEDNGAIMLARELGVSDRAALHLSHDMVLPNLNDRHRRYLRWNRTSVFEKY